MVCYLTRVEGRGGQLMNVSAVEVRTTQFHQCVTILSNVPSIPGVVWEADGFHGFVVKKTPLHRWLDPKKIHNNHGASKVEALSQAPRQAPRRAMSPVSFQVCVL